MFWEQRDLSDIRESVQTGVDEPIHRSSDGNDDDPLEDQGPTILALRRHTQRPCGVKKGQISKDEPTSRSEGRPDHDGDGLLDNGLEPEAPSTEKFQSTIFRGMVEL